MSAERLPKPPNNQRLLPTVSFSLSQSQLERLREIAYARDVSLSRVARDAIDTAFRFWDGAAAAAVGDASKRGASLQASDGKHAGEFHKPVRWPRQQRRDAARGGDYWLVSDSRLDDWRDRDDDVPVLGFDVDLSLETD